MGMVHADVTLKNVIDLGLAREGYIKPEEIRSITVTAVVDTGAMHLSIPEELRQKMGLATKGEKTAVLANGQRIRCKVTEPIEVHWRNRDTVVHALVIPGSESVLLGALALEGLDLIVNPVSQELVGAHGDEAEYAFYSYRLTDDLPLTTGQANNN